MTDDAFERVIDALHGHGCRVVERGHTQASSTCPAHDDGSPSLSVRRSDGRALVWCHAGCDTRDVVAAMGLAMADLYDERSATYRYDDGRTVKRFYDGRGKKKFTQTGAGPTSSLYRLEKLRTVAPGTLQVFLVEGEADVHAVETEGGVATTAPQGADSFHKVDVSPLTDHAVTVVVDRDAAGEKWARQVADKLEGVAERYRFVHAADGKDASDHIAAGHGLKAFVPMENPPEPKGARVVLTKASAFKMRAVKWLYRGRIPAGMLTLLAGREGIGKSTVSLDIAARLTRGTLPGRYEGRPQKVIICATEDSWSYTIVPRLLAVGADMDLVFHVVIREPTGAERSIVAPIDIRAMERAFRRVKPALMVIDPLMAIIDGKIDTHKQAEVQVALEPLVHMCDRLDMSVLALIHVNKSGGTDPLNSIMGSKAFTSLPRSVLYCIEEDDGGFMLCHIKCNVGPKMPSVAYRLQSVRFDLPPGDVLADEEPYIESSRVIWGEEDPRSAVELLQEQQDRSRLGEPSQDVLDLINEQGTATTQQLRQKLGQHNAKAIENALGRLSKKGQIVRVGWGLYQSAAITPKPKIE